MAANQSGGAAENTARQQRTQQTAAQSGAGGGSPARTQDANDPGQAAGSAQAAQRPRRMAAEANAADAAGATTTQATGALTPAATAQQPATAATAQAETAGAVAVARAPMSSPRRIYRVLALQTQLSGLNRDHPLVKVAPERQELEQWPAEDVDALTTELEQAVATEDNRARERQAQRPQPVAPWWQAVTGNQGRMLFRMIAVALVLVVLLGLLGSRLGWLHFGRDTGNGTAGAADEMPLKVIPRRFKD